jgi:hypothetical protein
MAAADRIGPTGRRRDEAGLADALALGLAQACALIPGVSRNGMTLAAARLRGFDRADANALSRHVALPIIVGATALKGVRLARRGVPPALASAFAAGVGAAFVSTLADVGVEGKPVSATEGFQCLTSEGRIRSRARSDNDTPVSRVEGHVRHGRFHASTVGSRC